MVQLNVLVNQHQFKAASYLSQHVIQTNFTLMFIMIY